MPLLFSVGPCMEMLPAGGAGVWGGSKRFPKQPVVISVTYRDCFFSLLSSSCSFVSVQITYLAPGCVEPTGHCCLHSRSAFPYLVADYILVLEIFCFIHKSLIIRV